MVGLESRLDRRARAARFARRAVREQHALRVLPAVRAAVRASGAEHDAVPRGRVHGASDDRARRGARRGSGARRSAAHRAGAQHRSDGLADPAAARRDHQPDLRAALPAARRDERVLPVHHGPRGRRLHSPDPVPPERPRRPPAHRTQPTRLLSL